jgi:hypothetical protein
MTGSTRVKGQGDGFDAGVSEQSIRKALDYARRLRARTDGDLLDFDANAAVSDEPVTLDQALSELPDMLKPRRTGMYRIPTQPPPKPEE